MTGVQIPAPCDHNLETSVTVSYPGNNSITNLLFQYRWPEAAIPGNRSRFRHSRGAKPPGYRDRV